MLLASSKRRRRWRRIEQSPAAAAAESGADISTISYSGPDRRPTEESWKQQQQQRVMQCNTHYNQPQNLPLGVGCILLMICTILTIPFPAESVDCFKCTSRNGSNRACEDPFHNLNTVKVISPVMPPEHHGVIYQTPCYAGRKGREGLFLASACIKLSGIFDATGESLVVRHCALDSGTLTQDTELARMSHCGKFQFEGDLLKGCVSACPEDACNSARPASAASFALVSLLVVVLIGIILVQQESLASLRVLS